MEEKEIKVLVSAQEEYFDNLEEALDYIKKHYRYQTSRIFRYVDDKWIPVSTLWPENKSETKNKSNRSNISFRVDLFGNPDIP